MPPAPRQPSASRLARRQTSRTLLTPPLPSLDSVIATVSSTPPFPTFTFSSNAYASAGAPFGTAQQQDPSANGYFSEQLLSDPPGSCGVKADVWIGAQLSSPPSPATIDSHSADSQAGGEYFPPSSESGCGDSPSAPHLRRANLSLNISGLLPNSAALGAGFSPASIVSSSAPYTADPLTLGMDPADDYFHFNDAALASMGAGDVAMPLAQQQPSRPTPTTSATMPLTAPSTTGTFPFRHPASQPSSPIRGVFMSGQQAFAFSPVAGRQRGATISGMSPFEASFPQVSLPPPAINGMSPLTPVTATHTPTAVPAHLTFTSIHHSPNGTPGSAANASPAPDRAQNKSAPSGIFMSSEQQNQAQTNSGLGVGGGDVTMEDVSQPSSIPSRRSSGSQQNATAPSVASAVASAPTTSGGLQTSDITEKLTLDRLTMLDNIVNQAQSAKEALLRGQEDRLPEALGNISNQLEIANDLGVGPMPTPRETTPNSGSQGSQALSPYSPTNPSTMSNAQQASMTTAAMSAGMQQLQMSTAVPSLPGNLLPSLPVGQSGAPSSAPTSTATPTANSPAAMPAPVMIQPPPAGDFIPVATQQLVYNNGGGNQIGNQMSQGMSATMPSTPINTTFGPGVVHAPMVSSPLAVLPPSRASSPKPYNTWLPDNVTAASVAVAAVTGGQSLVDGQLAQAQAQAQAHMQAQVQAQAQAQAHAHAHAHAQAQAQAAQAQAMGQPNPSSTGLENHMSHPPSRRPSIDHRSDGRPIARGRSSSNAKPGGSGLTLTSSASMPPSTWQSRQGSPVDDDDDDDDSDNEGGTMPRRPKRRRSSAGLEGNDGANEASTAISDDIRSQLDQIFKEFLNKICMDLDSCDAKGEKIHQVLMPKKMARLDESTDYRPFKFRIQAFTNAFLEELQARGITEDTMSGKKVKVYLWHQELISRFNQDGKKAKSKGNHIWHVEAKKLPGGGYIFRPFKRKIIGIPPTVVAVNTKYEWEPKIWDPMAPSANIKPTFSSPPGSLPHWLHWEDGTRLVGVPPEPCPPVHVMCTAEFIDGAGKQATAETNFVIQVVNMPQVDYQAAPVPQYYDPLAVAAAGVVNPGAVGAPGMQGMPMQGVGVVPVQQVQLQPGMGYPAGMPMYPQPGYHV